MTHLLDTALYLNGQITQSWPTPGPSRRDRQMDDAVMALVKFENGSAGTFEATRFAIGCKNQNSASTIHGAGGLLRFDLERLNHLEFVDATGPSTEQGPRDLLVTDLKHPIFGNFWRPGHIIGYEHTFIATLAEFLDCLARATPTSIRVSPTRSSRSRRSTRCCSPREPGSGPTWRPDAPWTP